MLKKGDRAQDAALGDPSAPFTEAMQPGPKAMAYLCRDFACGLPTDDPAVLLKRLAVE